MTDPDEPWPFSWAPPTRGMTFLDRAHMEEVERQQVVSSLAPVSRAAAQLPDGFAAVGEALRRFRAAVAELRENG